ncbi:hypothetical protein PENTCL1PPCAC_1496, partial [Pristionchus entomophagus]
MEVLTIGLVSTAIVIVIGFVLHKMWNKDEDTFAKARANKQITLLDDIAAPKKTTDNRKEKEKQQKKKEEKKKKAAANSADSKEDKPAAPAAAPASPPAAKPESPNPVTTAPTKKEQPKPEEPKKKETAAEPVALKKEEATPLQTSPAPEQKKPAQANGDKKANKKTSANKQVEEIENEEEFVEAKTKKNKKTEKKEAAPAPSAAPETTAPRHLSLKDLDTNKVVARLSSIDEIEIEYIEYLNNFFHETAINASRADKEAAIAKGKADESARALEKTKGDVKRLEKEMEGSSRLTHELATKAAAAGSEAQELKSRLAAIEVEKEKLCRDVDAAKKAAAAVVIPVLPDNKEELEKLNSDAKSASARIADLEEQLKATKESVAKERKQLEQSVLLQKTHEDTALGQEVLLAESRQNAKAIGERLTGLEQEKKSLEARLVEANKHCDELKEHAKQREATHAADTLSLKTMIEELNKEVHRFEEAKKEQTEMVSKLAAKEAELIKKCAALEDAEKQISAIKKGSESSSSAAEAQIAALTKRVSELSAALQEEKAARAAAAEIVVPVAEQKKEDVEEVVQLQKSAYLDAAPPTGPSADAEKVAELEKEVARLQEKNTELRTMNHSMVDQMNVLEKRIVANGVAAPAASPAPSTSAPAAEEKGGKKNKKKGRADKKEEAVAPAAAAPKEEKRAEEEERVRAERRLMQAHIGKLIGGATLDEAADTQAYEKWLKAAGASIKEAQEKAKKTPAPAPVAAPAAPSVPASDEETDQLRTENNTLRDALFLVTEELRTIEQLKTDREEDYVRRIAELEKKHGKAV